MRVAPCVCFVVAVVRGVMYGTNGTTIYIHELRSSTLEQQHQSGRDRGAVTGGVVGTVCFAPRPPSPIPTPYLS